MLFQRFERVLADASQVGAAQIQQRLTSGRVELQIDFEPALLLGEAGDKIRLARDPQPVGIDHHMPDRARPHCIEDSEEIGVQRWLAAGKLDQVGLTFAGDQRVEHALDGRERKLLLPRRR